MNYLPLSIAALVALSSTVASAQESGHPDPKQLRFSKWTSDFEVPDPIAITIDEKGRAYVTQTQRRKAQDLDIRNNRDWIANDVGFQSVEEKRTFYLERLDPSLSADNTGRVKDHNGDGSHDYRDLMQLSERIYLIEDTDGSGSADSMKIFAEDFKTEVTGIAAGVLVHEGNVYATVAPDVWKMRDNDDDGNADQREVVATGFGLHIAYGGHDMHGLTVGPEGKIYWTIGDKGISTTSREGKKFHYPNQGGVMRCNPDGSGFEVFAHGLRNVQELAFDDYGNLFGVDNDSDGPGEMERFVYIVRDLDAGWRCNYQYRGEGDYNPWHDEKIWHTYHDGQPAYFVPPIRNYVNGPAGFTRDPGTALGPDYRGYFFLTSAPNGQQYAFQVKADGASFKMVNDHRIGDGIPIVGINFGPDGALYGVDWGGGYPLNEKGSVWKLDVPEFADSKARLDTAEKLRADFVQHSSEQLAELLQHPDQRVRLKAQFRLATLEDPKFLTDIALDGARAELARVHSLWALIQSRRFSPRLNDLVDEANSELRAQFAKLAGESGDRIRLYADSLTRLVADPSQRVSFCAALSLGQATEPDSQATRALLTLAADLTPQQSYLRHACVSGLAATATGDELAALKDAESKSQRLCALLALRRTGSAKIAEFLNDSDSFIATEAARAIHDDFSIVDALPQLAATLNAPATSDQAFIRRALNAAMRIGTPEQAARMAQFATVTTDEEMVLESLELLSSWPSPDPFDRVTGRIRSFSPRNSDQVAPAVTPFLSKWLTHTEPRIQAAGMRLASDLHIEVPAEDLLSVLRRAENSSDLRVEALNTLHAQKADSLSQSVDLALDSDSSALRIRGGQLLVDIDRDRACDRLSPVAADNDAPTKERQAAFASLALVKTPKSDAFLGQWATKLVEGEVPTNLQLDVITAVETRSAEADSLRTLLVHYQSQFPAADFAATYQVCLDGGNDSKGRDIFNNHIAAQCTACHKTAKGKGSDVGPNLMSIGIKHPPEYLLEALLTPQTVIAKGYGMISVTLKNGDKLAATLRKETDSELELRDAEGNTTKVAVEDIAERSPVVSTMPPIIGLLSKAEIRDVIAYLKTLRSE